MSQTPPTESPLRTDKELFFEALDLPTVSDRTAFLERVCAGDPEKRKRLKELLANHFQQASFMADSAVESVPPGILEICSEGPGTIIGRYKLLEKLGEGGFGVVYVAEQKVPVKRRVALKIIKLGMDTRQVVARFEAERQALAMMDHPNIAMVFDAGATETGRPYFVMELVRGTRITQYSEENRLSIEGRVKLFIQVCHAIQHAHQKGIIHRDIKPSNILITLHDGVPLPKVIDFGIAKAVEGDLTDKTLYTHYHQFIGTPAYMSPEQAEMSGLNVDTRTDIYGLGVLLYELLTGATPFDGKELVSSGIDEMRRTIREQDPVRPSTRLTQNPGPHLNPNFSHSSIDRDLDWIVLKCLEKDRTRRYETVNGLARDLERYLNYEPVTAAAPTTSYKLRKFALRNRGAVVSAGLILLLLIAGTGVSTWQALVANQARITALKSQALEKKERLRADEQKLLAEKNLYIANMTLAQVAWEQNSPARMRQLLEETAAYPQRGFEWYYWQQRLHSQRKTIRGHGEAFYSAVFSPDAQRILTGSVNHTAAVWSVETGDQLLTLDTHSGYVTSVAYSKDAERIVTTGNDGTIKIWDARRGADLLTIQGYTSWITSACFSPDGRRLVITTTEPPVRLWDAATGKELLTLKGHAGGVRRAEFSPDGRRIVTASNDSTAKVWDAANGHELLTLKAGSNVVLTAVFSPDGQRIATAGIDGKIKVWDATSGQNLLNLPGHANLDGTGALVLSLAFSADSQRIVSGGSDNLGRVWDTLTGAELFTLKGHELPVGPVAFSPDSRTILTAGSDHTIRLWDASGKWNDGALTLRGHQSWIYSVVFSPDGRHLATASMDRTARLWDAETGVELHTLKGHEDTLSSVTFSPDGMRVATSSADKTAKIWDVATGQLLLTLVGHKEGVLPVTFSPDGRRIVTSGADGIMKIWNATNGSEILSIRGSSGYGIAFSPDGRRILCGSGGSTAKVWDSATGDVLLTLKGHNGDVMNVGFSRDGRRIVTASKDKTARVWDANTGRELFALLGHTSVINSAAFSPDGQRVATASDDHTARLWDATTGRILLTLKGHLGEVRSVAFSSDGRRIATCGFDYTAKIWRTATPEQVAEWQNEH